MKKTGRLNKYEGSYLRKQQRLQKQRKIPKPSFLKRIIKKAKKYIQEKTSRIIFNNTMQKKDINSKTIKKTRKEIQTQKQKQLIKSKSASKKNTKKINKKKTLEKIFKFGVVSVVFLVSLFFLWFATLKIPDVGNFSERKISNSTKIYDRTGEILLYDIHEDIQRTVVSYGDINQYVKDAIVSIEDHTFYTHKGVVWKSTLRAVAQTILSKLNLYSGGTAGGSTLTQQVVKNTLLTREQTIKRKVKEWVLAYKLEQQMTKDEILATYLNEAPYGGTIYGVEEASRVFFGKKASNVTLSEAAYLASIPNIPTYYSPYGSNKDKLDKRQRTVLSQMKLHGYISEEEYREALDEEVEFLPQELNYAKSLHFVQYVRAQLEETYGIDVVENGGLRVITTLDYDLQKQAEVIIADHIEEVEDQYDASNAALVALESKTGQIIAMVGSRSYFDTEGFDGNFNVALAKRQPGSSFKPIAYAAAFEKGYLPESAIFDTETQFNSSCERNNLTSTDGCYAPGNYDAKFNGPMTWRNALAQSRNIPAIKVLYLAGLSNVIKIAKSMGISSLNEASHYYGLGLVLGGGEVSLLEMTGVYATFSNEGNFNKINSILEVTDAEGEVLEKYVPEETRIFSENTARMISSILSDNTARTPLFGAYSFLNFGETNVAGKTGTTNDNRDAWLIGYTSDVAVGVWTGNNDNTPMKKGSSISGKPWRSFMDEVLKKYKAYNFVPYSLPENFDELPNMIKGNWKGGNTFYINSDSKKLATEFTPEENITEITEIDPHTILHWINKNDPTVLQLGGSDIQYKNWEYSVQNYIQLELNDLFDIEYEIPTEYDEAHDTENMDGDFDFTIEGVLDIEYEMDDNINIEIDLDDLNKNDVAEITYSINNIFIGSMDSFREFSFKPEDIQFIYQNNELSVTVVDEDGNDVTRTIDFRVSA